MFGRLSRNAFIVLALIIPIVAGMGINFAITIGAMAAQIAALWVIEWGVGGFGGFLLAMLLTMPIAALFGFLIGKLLNKMKGQEMIGGLILGYFANGLYQLLARLEVQTLYLPDIEDEYGVRERLLRLAEKNGIEVVYVRRTVECPLGGAVLSLYPRWGRATSMSRG